jgi:hypothetical protein
LATSPRKETLGIAAASGGGLDSGRVRNEGCWRNLVGAVTFGSGECVGSGFAEATPLSTRSPAPRDSDSQVRLDPSLVPRPLSGIHRRPGCAGEKLSVLSCFRSRSLRTVLFVFPPSVQPSAKIDELLVYAQSAEQRQLFSERCALAVFSLHFPSSLSHPFAFPPLRGRASAR